MFIPWTSGWEHLHLHTFSQLWSICRCHHQWNFRFMQRRSLCFSTKVYSSFLFHFLIPVQCLSSGHRVWTFEQIISQAGSWFRGFLFAGLYSALCYFLFTSIRNFVIRRKNLPKYCDRGIKNFSIRHLVPSADVSADVFTEVNRRRKTLWVLIKSFNHLSVYTEKPKVSNYNFFF